MEYRIISATFEYQVYNEPNASGANKYVPFLNRSEIGFTDARMGEVTVSDDDGGTTTQVFTITVKVRRMAR